MIEMFDVRKSVESPVKGKEIRIDIDEEEGEDDPGRYDTLDEDQMRSGQTQPHADGGASDLH